MGDILIFLVFLQTKTVYIHKKLLQWNSNESITFKNWRHTSITI